MLLAAKGKRPQKSSQEPSSICRESLAGRLESPGSWYSAKPTEICFIERWTNEIKRYK
jgi:hypothetical protein